MSSLSATQADGYYIPPSYIESGKYKKQSINQFQQSKGHNQYLQRSVVRFELPYDGFCVGCEGHVGKGTRFNAHKSDAGSYFTSKIYEFNMKCRLCANSTFIIRTNPQGRCFDYVSGIKKKVEEFDTVEAGTVGVIDTDVGNGIIPSSALTAAAATSLENSGEQQHDPLSKLESSAMGERKVLTERDQMEALLTLQNSTMMNDADSNAALRSKFRVSRKAKKRRLAKGASSGLGYGIEVHDDDDKHNVYNAEERKEARLVFGSSTVLDQRARKREKDSFLKVRSGSIFGGSSDTKKKKSLRGGMIKHSSKHQQRRDLIEKGDLKKSSTPLKKTGKITVPSLAARKSPPSTNIPKSDNELSKNDSDVITKKEAALTPTKPEASSLSFLADYGSDSDASD